MCVMCPRVLAWDRQFRQYERRDLQCWFVHGKRFKKGIVRTHSEACAGFNFIEAQVGKDPDQRNYIVSNAKLEATGFAPEFSLDRGH